MSLLKLSEHEELVFDIYFAGLMSMNIHPGAGRSNGYGTASDRMTIEETAGLALDMIRTRRQVVSYGK